MWLILEVVLLMLAVLAGHGLVHVSLTTGVRHEHMRLTRQLALPRLVLGSGASKPHLKLFLLLLAHLLWSLLEMLMGHSARIVRRESVLIEVRLLLLLASVVEQTIVLAGRCLLHCHVCRLLFGKEPVTKLVRVSQLTGAILVEVDLLLSWACLH